MVALKEYYINFANSKMSIVTNNMAAFTRITSLGGKKEVTTPFTRSI